MVTHEPSPDFLDDSPPRNGASRRPERAVPANHEAEKMVLGAIMAENGIYEQIAGTLVPEDFLDDRHKTIFSAARELALRGNAIEPVTVGNELAARGELRNADDYPYLIQLVNDLHSTVGAASYAELVLNAAIYRDMIRAAGRIGDIAYRADPDIGESLAQAQEELYGIRGADQRRDFRLLSDLLTSLLADDDGNDGLSEPTRTGFADLDELLNEGIHASDLMVLAARPGVGKSALALSIARNAAIGQNRGVAIFSLEMAADQIVQRLVTAESGVPIPRLRPNRHDDEEDQKINGAIASLSRAQIFIDDTAGLTLFDLRAKARNLHRQLLERSRHNEGRGALGLIIVDHIQLVHAFSRAGGDFNRVNEISQISRTLKEIARDLQVPVLALSQLSRDIEKRPNKQPMLSDLRDSGSIEQDADVVVFIHPEYLYEFDDFNQDQYGGEQVRSGDEDGKAKLIVAKHRHGELGDITVRWVPRVIRFEDYWQYQEPDEVEF